MRQDAASNEQEGLQDRGQYGTGQGRIGTSQESGKRVTVYEAADALGVTVDAIRKRIQRGTIPHERRHEDGRVYVLLDEAATLQDQSSEKTSTVQDPVQDSSPVQYGTHEFIESLQDQIGFLRRELERKDAILLRMSERIPELEAAPEPRGERVSHFEGNDDSTGRPDDDQDRQKPPWWRRFFGFE